jgi:hypothetical protein
MLFSTVTIYFNYWNTNFNYDNFLTTFDFIDINSLSSLDLFLTSKIHLNYNNQVSHLEYFFFIILDEIFTVLTLIYTNKIDIFDENEDTTFSKYFFISFTHDLFMSLNFMDLYFSLIYDYFISYFVHFLGDDFLLTYTILNDYVTNSYSNNFFSESTGFKFYIAESSPSVIFIGMTSFNFLSLLLIILFYDSTRFDLEITEIDDLYNIKVFFMGYSFSKFYRIDFNLLLWLIFFLFDSFIFAIMQIDEFVVEFIELVHLTMIYFLILVIIFLLFKYSIHYFSFLEQSVSEGKSALFIAKQFVRDVSNTFALFLRFFLLLFRLNIYDGLDDFLDSYCIFFAEFNENIENDFMILNTITSLNVGFDIHMFDYDLNNPEFESFSTFNLLLVYYLWLIEIINYWLFLLEEIFRIILAFYIIYLIIFEVHTVNCFYTENYGIRK